MKKWILVLCALAVPTVFAEDVNKQILEKLDALQRQVMQQQAEIESLKAQLASQNTDVTEMVRSEVDTAIEAKGLAQVKDIGPVIRLPKNIEGLDIKGDVRFRYERRITDDDTAAPGTDTDTHRDRFRTRFRLGAVWQTTDGWEIGAGLATGGADSTSTNDTWSDNAVFETGDIRLDYAYAKHSWNCYSLLVGQTMNPFVSSFLLWDGDIRPVGVTGQYRCGGVFATVGWYNVRDLGEDDDLAQMVAGQIGYELDLENMNTVVAAAYYHFNDATNQALSTFNNAGVLINKPASDVGYDIVDLYAKVTMPMEDVTLSAYGEVWKNLGADGNAGDGQLGGAIDPDGNELGWVLGVGAKMGRFSTEYAYGRVESDSFPGVLTDADFGATAGVNNTNVKGHRIKLGYQITENMSINGTMFHLTEIEGDTQEGKLYQVDLNYKF